MGTDIYGVFQKFNKEEGRWVGIDTQYSFNKHRVFFDFLCDDKDHICKPLTNYRGYPQDMTTYDKTVYFEQVYRSCSSWFLATEYLSRIKEDWLLTMSCWVDRGEYERWDRLTHPVAYLKWKPEGCVAINDTEQEKTDNPNWEYIKVKWTEDSRVEFEYFTKELESLIKEHQTDQIRFVFSFD